MSDELGTKKVTDILYAIGTNHIGVDAIYDFLKQEYTKEEIKSTMELLYRRGFLNRK